ncbi:hypothetical protein N781_05305 [Pontibacillus halophilus JSM 076056 = DSM 19796]|uniref:Type VII secretion protein EssA n=1 Tax=Pontibacillus halophilus JSM 076056 = DSM 19796 TaxID=1385510 RepID=A0A0A5I5S1_9BACI|nr:type VII secretion protein EssA [Pontibacillus halophilus]KGX91177.1 hypothetical protein N781_05305 [Pontibacillus halophilus JSM 076056 = DSM 19796]
MKRRAVVLCLIILWLGVAQPIEASIQSEDLTPNEYEQNKSKERKNKPIGDDTNQPTYSIPEEQKALNFGGEKTFNEKEVERELFQSYSSEETNTITSKADNLQLFSSEVDVRRSVTLVETEETETSAFSMSLLIGSLAVVCIVGLIFVLVAWARMSNPSSNQS